MGVRVWLHFNKILMVQSKGIIVVLISGYVTGCEELLDVLIRRFLLHPLNHMIKTSAESLYYLSNSSPVPKI